MSRPNTLAVFPSRPGRSTDAVPTSVERGEDGAYYVGELTGFPNVVGAARVYRVVPGRAPRVFCSGFTAIIDVGFADDDDDDLYVLQFATGPDLTGPAILYRVDSDDCSRTAVVEGLFTPGGIAFRDEDTVYISEGSVLAGAGEVRRYNLEDDD